MVERKTMLVAVVVIAIIVVGSFAWYVLNQPMGTTVSEEWLNTLYIAVKERPSSLVPEFCQSYEDNRIQKEVYETLMMFPASGGDPYLPCLATSWEFVPETVSTPATVTFHLREGVKFHSGDPFNATAVVYNMDVWTHGPYAFILADTAQSWEEIDEYIVKFTLQKPAPSWWKDTFAHPFSAIMNPNFCEKHGGMEVFKTGVEPEYLVTHADGTGPYMCGDWGGEWIPGERLVYMRNPNYWGTPKPKLEKIVKRYIDEPATRMMLLSQGDVDIAHIPMSMLPDVENAIARGDLDLYLPGKGVFARARVCRLEMRAVDESTLEMAEKYNVTLSPPIPHLPFSDENFRKALQYSFDHETYINEITHGYADDYRMFCGLGSQYYIDTPKYEYNLTKAKEYLEKASPEALEAAEKGFTITCSTDPMQVDIATFAKDCFKKLGLKVTVDSVDDGTAYSRGGSGKFDMIVQCWGLMGYDPYVDVTFTQHTRFYPEVCGWMGDMQYFGNETTDNWLDDAGLEIDEEKRLELYKKVKQAEYEHAARIYVGQASIVMLDENVYATYVKGWQASMWPYYCASNYVTLYKESPKTEGSIQGWIAEFLACLVVYPHFPKLKDIWF